MSHFPARYDGEEESEPRIVEAEIVEEGEVRETSTSFFRGLLSRVVLSIILGLLGAAMIAAGVVLTVTIIGAPFGIPLVIIGLLVCFVAFLSFFARGQVGFTIVRPRE